VPCPPRRQPTQQAKHWGGWGVGGGIARRAKYVICLQEWVWAPGARGVAPSVTTPRLKGDSARAGRVRAARAGSGQPGPDPATAGGAGTAPRAIPPAGQLSWRGGPTWGDQGLLACRAPTCSGSVAGSPAPPPQSRQCGRGSAYGDATTPPALDVPRGTQARAMKRYGQAQTVRACRAGERW
jgi:hypothetical protein